MIRGLFHRADHASGAGVAWLRAALAFLLLNTLLTFENRWPGFGVLYMPRLSFELCVGVALLALWVGWRGALSARAATALALGFVALVVVRYAGIRAGLVVDQLLGEFQTVIKPLGKVFCQVPALSGFTILGSGAVALILDIPGLLTQVTQHANTRIAGQSNALRSTAQ